MKNIIFPFVLIVCFPLLATAGYREDFAREFMSKTWAGERIEENACLDCHSSDRMKPAFQDLADEWKKSWHAQNNIACHDCHGGDPRDASQSMSHLKGFTGVPSPQRIPEFCGRCHIGILKNYLESGHGKALKTSGKGPHCAICHGSHNVQRANLDIINEQRCSRCHSYERARAMKQAMFLIEKKIGDIEDGIKALKRAGIYPEDEERALFSTQAEFRSLFHTVDVSLVKDRTDEFTKKLVPIEQQIRHTFAELSSRKNYSAFLMALFGGLAIIMFMISRTPKE